MKVSLIAWGAIAVLIIGVRIGHGFGYKGYKDAHEEMQTPRRRELGTVARLLDPDLVRRRRQRTALFLSFLILVTAAAIWWQ